MKLSFEINDFELQSQVFIELLKNELKNSTEFLESNSWKHENDVKMYQNNVDACKILLDYYGGNDEN